MAGIKYSIGAPDELRRNPWTGEVERLDLIRTPSGKKGLINYATDTALNARYPTTDPVYNLRSNLTEQALSGGLTPEDWQAKREESANITSGQEAQARQGIMDTAATRGLGQGSGSGAIAQALMNLSSSMAGRRLSAANEITEMQAQDKQRQYENALSLERTMSGAYGEANAAPDLGRGRTESTTPGLSFAQQYALKFGAEGVQEAQRLQSGGYGWSKYGYNNPTGRSAPG